MTFNKILSFISTLLGSFPYSKWEEQKRLEGVIGFEIVAYMRDIYLILIELVGLKDFLRFMLVCLSCYVLFPLD